MYLLESKALRTGNTLTERSTSTLYAIDKKIRFPVYSSMRAAETNAQTG